MEYCFASAERAVTRNPPCCSRTESIEVVGSVAGMCATLEKTILIYFGHRRREPFISFFGDPYDFSHVA